MSPLIRDIVSLAAGESVTIELTEAIRFSIVPEGTAVVDYSKVDDPDASTHDADSQKQVTAETVIDVDWPYYHISTVTAGCRVGIV